MDGKAPDFGAAAHVTIADHRHRIGRDEHLVVPGGIRIDVRAECVNRRERFQSTITNRDGEQAAAAQNHQMIAMKFDDAAFVHAGMLGICDRLVVFRGITVG